MTTTGRAVVLQSHRETGLPAWIGQCLESVRDWSNACGHTYRFTGDEMMRAVPETWRKATARYPQIAADLGRLYLIRNAFESGADTALWLDADVAVLDPAHFNPLAADLFAFGREVWIEALSGGGYRARINVHNAVIMMRRGNPVLDFYIYAAERVLEKLTETGGSDSVPPQVIGPKLLGALNNIAGFPLIDSVGMLSPPVLNDLATAGDGDALRCFRTHLESPIHAVNLSASLVDDDSIADAALARMLANPTLLNSERKPA